MKKGEDKKVVPQAIKRLQEELKVKGCFICGTAIKGGRVCVKCLTKGGKRS